MATNFQIAGVNGKIEGTGEQTIVMIHGWPDTQELWQNQVNFFKNQGNRTTKPLKSKNRLNCEQKGEPSCSPIRLTI